MFVKFVLSELVCHWIVPELPLSVSVVLFAPEHTGAAPEIVPGTEPAFTITVVLDVFAAEQVPLVTTAL
jgi:hypothetical protein